MSKIALIADTHFGCRKNSDAILESQKRFFLKQFYPYLREKEIKQIFCLGDTFDNRTGTNTKIANEVYDLFNTEFQYSVIVGNHDCFLNSNTHINSLKFLRKFSNVNVFEKMQEIEMFGRKFLFCPWFFDNAKFLEDIKKYESDVVFSHLDLNGFFMGSKISDSALMPNTFSKFKKVFSGHFHTKQTKMFGATEFLYVGSPVELDWGDCEQLKGFYILETDDLSYEFIENTVSSKHVKIEYGKDFKDSDVSNNFVKIFLKEADTEDTKRFDDFTQKLTESGIASVATVIIKDEDGLEEVEIDEKGQNLLELIVEFLFLQQTIENKKEIQEIIENIYTESLRE